MMFSTRAEYGVRVMVELGRRHGEGPVPLAEIAASARLPLAYLEHLVADLRAAELVRSTRGAHGGYELAQPTDETKMIDIVYALEGTIIPMQCFMETDSMSVLCDHETGGYDSCATRLLWMRVQGSVAKALEQTTLAELVEFSAQSTSVGHKARPAKRAGSRGDTAAKSASATA